MRIALLLLTVTVLLVSCNRHRDEGIQAGGENWNCRKDTGGPWKQTGTNHDYDLDKVDADEVHSDHRAICLSQENKDEIRFHSQQSGFWLRVTPVAHSPAKCDPHVALIRNDNEGKNCVAEVNIKIEGSQSRVGCSYEVFPHLGCTPGREGGTVGGSPGADPHVRIAK